MNKVEVFEATALSIAAFILIMRDSNNNDIVPTINGYYIIPTISYCIWLYIIGGYIFWATDYQNKRCCRRLWFFVICSLSFCFMVCHPTKTSLDCKVLTASKFRRYCIFLYYVHSYANIQIASGGWVFIAFLIVEICIIFVGAQVVCYRKVKRMKRFRNLTFSQVVKEKAKLHFLKEPPISEDSDYDEDYDGKYEKAKFKTLLMKSNTSDDIQGEQETNK